MKIFFKCVLVCLLLVGFKENPLNAQEKTNGKENEATTPPQTEEGELFPTHFAEELRKAEEEGGGSRFFDEFVNMLFSLGIIIGIIFIVMWIFKRVLKTHLRQVNLTSSIKILESRSLTPKTTLYIIGILGKAVAIADSINGITLLSEVPVKNDKLQKEKGETAPSEE